MYNIPVVVVAVAFVVVVAEQVNQVFAFSVNFLLNLQCFDPHSGVILK
jgi:hypothetical protein